MGSEKPGNAAGRNIEEEWPEWKISSNLFEFGMNNAELEAWFDLAKAAKSSLKLPELYGMDKHELCHYFHLIQAHLLSRPGMRVLGHEPKEKGQE